MTSFAEDFWELLTLGADLHSGFEVHCAPADAEAVIEVLTEKLNPSGSSWVVAEKPEKAQGDWKIFLGGENASTLSRVGGHRIIDLPTLEDGQILELHGPEGSRLMDDPSKRPPLM